MKAKITSERLCVLLNRLMNWVLEHDDEFVDEVFKAMGVTYKEREILSNGINYMRDIWR